jgi:hypothetical protein
MKIKAYKVFNHDWTCRGFQYEIGKKYVHKGEIILCGSGFHACPSVADCFSYYDFDPNNKIAEVTLSGRILGQGDGDKLCASVITIERELTWEEMLKLANSGAGNTGLRNSGDSNSGNRNSGYGNSGNSNSGDSNSGNRNSGNSNSGYGNSGNSNSGNRNSGDSNSGNRNSGYGNSGDSNSGNRNSGNSNSGDSNSGYGNSGYGNSGNRNSGYGNSGNRNSGYGNSGNSNSGYGNSGNRNSGNRNSGNSNSGYGNSGDSNSGHYNSGSYQSGCFNTDESPMRLFNGRAEISRRDLEQHAGWIAMESVPLIITDRVPDDKDPSDYRTVRFEYQEAWSKRWAQYSDKKRQLIQTLPGFCPEIFKEITGIDVSEVTG